MCTQRISNAFLSFTAKYPQIFNHPNALHLVENSLSQSLSVIKIDLKNRNRSAKISSFVLLHFAFRVAQSSFTCGFVGYVADRLIDRVVTINDLSFMRNGAFFGATFAVVRYLVPYLTVHANIQAELPALPQNAEPLPPKDGYRPRVQRKMVS